MSGEAKLRKALATVFESDRWYDDSGDHLWVDLDDRLEEVIGILKEGEWLITGGTVHHLHHARYDGAQLQHNGDETQPWHQPWQACTDG